MNVAPLYRARQFFHAIAALTGGGQISETDAALIIRYLSPPQQAIFNAMPAHDRRHSLAVLHTLRQMGEDNPDLMAASLLHDIGKSEYDSGGRLIRTVPLWCRVAKVVIAILPAGKRLLQRFSAQGAKQSGWKHSFYLSWEHPRRGAELATQLGASAQTAALILNHMQPRRPTDLALLRALKRADDVN
jgi:hypothetical protein